MTSIKIPQVYIDGCFHYRSEVKPLYSSIVCGDLYYDAFFTNDNNFNMPYEGGAYISRIKITEHFSYIESNTPLDESEITTLNNIAKLFEGKYIKHETFSNIMDPF